MDFGLSQRIGEKLPEKERKHSELIRRILGELPPHYPASFFWPCFDKASAPQIIRKITPKIVCIPLQLQVFEPNTIGDKKTTYLVFYTPDERL